MKNKYSVMKIGAFYRVHLFFGSGVARVGVWCKGSRPLRRASARTRPCTAAGPTGLSFRTAPPDASTASRVSSPPAVRGCVSPLDAATSPGGSPIHPRPFQISLLILSVGLQSWTRRTRVFWSRQAVPFMRLAIMCECAENDSEGVRRPGVSPGSSTR